MSRSIARPLTISSARSVKSPGLRAEDKAQLDKSALFGALTPDLTDRLLRDAKIKACPEGAVLWKRGERARFVFVVLSGRIGVYDTMADDRRSVVIDLFRAGDVIAGAPTLTGAPYLFSGRAVDDSRVLTIPIAQFRGHLKSEYSLLLATALNLVESWRRLVSQVRDLKQFSANQRLGLYLLAQVDRTSETASVRLIDDQLLIAGILGVTRESLSRSFAQLRSVGVSKRGRVVTITDPRRLRAYCDNAFPASHLLS